MRADTRNMIIGAVISALIASGTATISYIVQEDSIKEQIERIKMQNIILNDTLTDQQEQTKILNQTLTNLEKSLERKSLISVKVLPYTEELYNPFGAGYKIKQGGGIFEREIYPTQSAIPPDSKHYYEI